MLTDPSVVVASVRAAVDIVKKFANTPLKAEYLALMDQMMTIREQVADLQEELHSARRRVRELEDAAQTKANVTFDRGVYWTGETRTPGADGPYCPRCLDVDNKLVRLKADAEWCPECKNYFTA